MHKERSCAVFDVMGRCFLYVDIFVCSNHIHGISFHDIYSKILNVRSLSLQDLSGSRQDYYYEAALCAT